MVTTLVAALAVWAFTHAGGAALALLYLAPALLLALSLRIGYYPGERMIALARGRRRRRPRAAAFATFAAARQALPRGGRLVGTGLAGRAPPAWTVGP
jgi:hypothetical protein